MIKIKDLTFAYGKKMIFKDLSCDVAFDEDHRILAFVGPNGCGKSTLLKLIGGHLKEKKGHIEIDGMKSRDIAAKERPKLLGMIQQNSKFDFPFSCFDTVLMGRYAHKGEFEDYRPIDVEISINALKEVGMAHLMDQSITEVSGGEFQRVMIARTLAQSPKLILLDEAFSAMDIRHKQETLEMLRTYAQKKDVYILMVVHDINLAYKYADSVMMMKDGEIIHQGKTKLVVNEASILSIFDVKMKQIDREGFLLV